MITVQIHQGSPAFSSSLTVGSPPGGWSVDARQKRMVVGAEHRRPAVERVLVEPHHARGRHALEPVTQEHVVQHQPRQRPKRVKGVPPLRGRRGDAGGELRLVQEPPGTLAAAAAEVEVRAEDDQVATELRDQVRRLPRPPRDAEPRAHRAARAGRGAR